jgi:hypothetical protein
MSRPLIRQAPNQHQSYAAIALSREQGCVSRDGSIWPRVRSTDRHLNDGEGPFL